MMNSSPRLVLSAVLALLLVAAPALQPASAAIYSDGTATATMLVTVTIQANCTIAASPLAFGNTGVLASAVNQQSTLSITCSNTTPYNVGLDAGTVSGSAVASRLMAGTTTGNTGTTLGFQIYQDSGRATVWGNTQGTNSVAGTGTGSMQTINVYGQVAAQSTPPPDTYQTTITATVYF